MVCYEHMRKKIEEESDDDMFWRLNSYFHALHNEYLTDFHKERGHKKNEKKSKDEII